MAVLKRLYSWLKEPDLLNEFNSIVNTWNQHDAGSSTWNSVNATSVTTPTLKTSSGSTATSISSDGEITQPLQPSFLVTSNAATNVTGDTTVYTIVWDNEIKDQGADFATNTFTAPITGSYLLGATVIYSGAVADNTDGTLTIVTSNRNYSCYINDITALVDHTLQVNVLADMDANDTAYVTLKVNGTTKGIDTLGPTYSFFSGSLIN
jgi:hypothetical protein